MDGYDYAGSWNTQAIFNASQYSNVYKDNCTKVQPPSVKYPYCIQISGATNSFNNDTTINDRLMYLEKALEELTQLYNKLNENK